MKRTTVLCSGDPRENYEKWQSSLLAFQPEFLPSGTLIFPGFSKLGMVSGFMCHPHEFLFNHAITATWCHCRSMADGLRMLEDRSQQGEVFLYHIMHKPSEYIPEFVFRYALHALQIHPNQNHK